MKASIIIPTYRRADTLKETLLSINSQRPDDVELLIVHQDDQPDRELEQWCKDHNFTYFYNETPSTTLARNRGLKESSGEIVIFFDDDVELLPGCLEAHLANYADPAVAGVGGRVVSVTNVEDPVKERVDVIGEVDANGRLHGGYNYNSLGRLEQRTTPRGCNMSYRRTILDRLGGFDEKFTGNAFREETDMALRALAAGGKLVFDPKAGIKHFLWTGGGSRAKPKKKWYLDFFYNNAYFYFRHVAPWRYPIAFLDQVVPWLKYQIKHARSWADIVMPLKVVGAAWKNSR